MSTQDTTTSRPNAVRILVIGALIVAAFFGAYRFAAALSAPKSEAQVAANGAAAAPGSVQTASGNQNAAGGSGCACCGGASQPVKDGVTGTKTEGSATVAGGVQKIDVTAGASYSPNVIKLKAGVPAELTFNYNGQGCTNQVVFPDLGISQDISQGPTTVKLGSLKAGTYTFSCGMNMIFGKVVVQ